MSFKAYSLIEILGGLGMKGIEASAFCQGHGLFVFRVFILRFRVWDSGLRVSGSGLLVQGSGLRVEGCRAFQNNFDPKV